MAAARTQRLLRRQATTSPLLSTSSSSSISGRFRAVATNTTTTSTRRVLSSFPTKNNNKFTYFSSKCNACRPAAVIPLSSLAYINAAATPISTFARTARRGYSSKPPQGSNNSVKFWPFAVIIALGFGGYALLVNNRADMSTLEGTKKPGELPAPTKSTPTFSADKVTVVFVLGGPGAGKGTQCANLVKDYGFKHLSAGDLLRAEQDRPGSQFGELIKDYIKNGLIVPQEVTIQLLENAMTATLDPSGKGDIQDKTGKFLIDGFPRKMDQAHKFEESVCPARVVLFFDCPEAEMERRLLDRGKTSGRSDDNAESIRKRFRTFVETSMPVVDYYEKLGKVVKVDATPMPDQVYTNTRKQLEGRLGGL